MASKFGKFLAFTTVVCSVAAAAYYFAQKNDLLSQTDDDEDFDEPDAFEGGILKRKYVSLKPNEEGFYEEKEFTPLKDTIRKVVAKVSHDTEEFFDEDDDLENVDIDPENEND